MMFNGRLKLIDVDGCVPIDSEVGWVGFEIWRVVFFDKTVAACWKSQAGIQFQGSNW